MTSGMVKTSKMSRKVKSTIRSQVLRHALRAMDAVQRLDVGGYTTTQCA